MSLYTLKFHSTDSMEGNLQLVGTLFISDSKQNIHFNVYSQKPTKEASKAHGYE